tara:strand:+ start:12654 stop:13589 length:936 start_codon:yes stop_codon:yes gene_type:complete
VKIYHSIEDFPSDLETVVTIGTFDGVHKGHRILIHRINEIAKKEGLKSVLLTFEPHPRHVIYPDDQELRLIHTITEKEEALVTTGLQNLVVQKFSKDFSRIKSINFVRDYLVNKLNMKYMVVGFDHHFGKNREGTFQDLKDFSDLYDFKIEEIDPQNLGQVTISSTKIRSAIQQGKMQLANSYLSSSFSLKGRVVEGKKIGSSIGFPTANLIVEKKWKILPKDGVYAVKVLIKEQQYFGMLNLGTRPSIADSSFVIEVHIFSFKDILYSQEIKIEFVSRMRDERKFVDLDQLQKQLKIDEVNCKKFFNLLR